MSVNEASHLSRRRFLERSLAVCGAVHVLGGAATAGDGSSQTARQEQSSSGDEHESPPLRAIFAIPSDLWTHPYWPAMNWLKFKESDLAWAREAGFNAVYTMYNPYRSEEGAVPWQEDIPPSDPNFAAVARLTAEDRAASEQAFQQYLAACRRQNLQIMFNAGWWATQAWFRTHLDAISRFPDGSPQYDAPFLRQRQPVASYSPCFRSETFRRHAQDSVRAWLRQYRGNADFAAVLCRCRVADLFDIRLDRQGFPLFIMHQDTVDRNWCHCPVCRSALRRRLEERYQTIEAANRELGTRFAAFSEVTIPVSLDVAHRERFAAIDLFKDPERYRRLWYETACSWSEGIAGWRAGIVRTIREFYPRGEVMTISKYPHGAFLTHFPLIARGNKVFSMDSYPMEGGRTWELLRWLFEIEIYQSAAAQQGQALVAQLQGFNNMDWGGHASRGPWPAEFSQQHAAMLSRGVGGTVTAGFDHRVQLTPAGMQQGLLVDDSVTALVHRQNARMADIERASRGTLPYRGGVVLRYNPLAACDRQGAGPLFARYKYWKDRGLPVSVVWDEKRTDETVPESFEFALEGSDTRDTDLAIRSGKSSYVVTLINLRNAPRDFRLRVRLKGQEMARYEARAFDKSPPLTVEHSAGNLVCSLSVPALAAVVLRLDGKPQA